MEELIAAIPYLNKGEEEPYGIKIAGTGIEYNYMTSPTKQSLIICVLEKRP